LTRLLISEIFPPKTGGTGRWYWELYRRLPRESYIIAAGEDARQDAFDRTHDLRVARLPLTLRAWSLRSLTGLRGYARAIRGLHRLVRREGITEVYCGRCLPEGVMALALKLWAGLPYACYVHGEEGAPFGREYNWLVRRVFRGAEFLIANTRNTMRVMQEDWGVPESKLRLLHPGVDTTRFTPADRDQAVREALGWGRRPVVLTVSRLQLRKGHDQMILALRTIRRAVPDVLYAIVGDGEERPRLQDLVAREGLQDHVQLLGELDEDQLLRCYQQCDLFVLPNRQVGKDIEGFGLVLLEAQACGKPVVAGASGGTAETMDIPETGLVVPCEAPDELARAVAELLLDLERRARMGRAGRDWVVSNFDWETLALQAEQIFPLRSRDVPDRLSVPSVRS
jgi:phosphatidyl-myo-inositol dimannoside synthase